MPLGPANLASIIALVAVWGGAWADWREGVIPRWLSIAAFGSGVLVHFLGWGVYLDLRRGLLASLVGAGICGVGPYLFWLIRLGPDRRPLVGGGDVRLIASLGALLGFYDGLAVSLLGFGLASVVTLASFAWRGVLLGSLWNAIQLAFNPFVPRRLRATPAAPNLSRLPFAPFLAVAATVILLPALMLQLG